VTRSSPVVAILVLACAGGACADARRTHDRALKEFRKGNSDEALKEIERVSGRHSPREYWQWRVRLLEADIAIGDGRLKDAEKLLALEVPQGPDYRRIEARRRSELAYAALRSGNFEKSRTLLDEARQIAPAEDEDLLLQIDTLRGWWAMRAGPAGEALVTLDAAYNKAVNLGDSYRQCAVLNNLGMLSAGRGRYDEAISYFERALDAGQRAEAYKYVGNILGNLGMCCSRVGDFDQALKYTMEAVERKRKDKASADLESNLGKLGNIYYLQGDMKTAIRYYEEALPIARSLGLNSDASIWAGNLASAYAEAGNWDAAERINRELLEVQTSDDDVRRRESQWKMNQGDIAAGRGQLAEAASIYNSLINTPNQNPGIAWEANAQLGNVYSRLKKASLASQHYEQALRIIETTRGRLLRNEFKITFLQGLIRFYHLYVDHLVAHGEIERALEVADSSRARLLAENFGLDPKAFLSRAGDSRVLARAMGAVLLSYWTGPQHSYVWVITPTEVKLSRLPSQGEIEKLVNSWNKAIGDLRDPVAENIASGQRLAEMLIANAAGLPPRSPRVVLIPDGPLHKLNFETLPVNGQPWIETTTIAIAPALRVLRDEETRRAEQALLVIGNPETSTAEFPKLTHAQAEIDKIRSHFPAAGSALYSGLVATPASYFAAHPEKFSVIHFASHAVANAQSPLDSAIILGEGPQRAYKLYARDILNQRLVAELVTISACRSAGVKSYAGEGLVGLAWAFLQTGAQSVIGGLWDVVDSSTAELMDKLYGGITAAKDPVEALRDAKLALLRAGGGFHKPYYWAPFQIYVRTRPWTSGTSSTKKLSAAGSDSPGTVAKLHGRETTRTR
jgi:CHAT domain-containing protein